jgi:microcystin-dependent protein
LNGNFDTIDTTMKANADAVAAKLTGPTIGPAIHALAAKTVPDDADEFGYADSVGTPTWLTKKFSWANIKAALGIRFLPPLGTVLDYAGPNAPSGWLFCYGQEVSRTTYAALFNIIGTTYGVGNGTTTFNLPDLRGRVVAGQDDMGGVSANRLTGLSGGVDGDVLGGAGGLETHTLTTAQLAAHTHTGTTGASGTHTHNISSANNQNGSGGFGIPNFSGGSGLNKATDAGGDHTHTFTSDAAGSGNAHNNVQPTIVLNKIICTGV